MNRIMSASKSMYSKLALHCDLGAGVVPKMLSFTVHVRQMHNIIHWIANHDDPSDGFASRFGKKLWEQTFVLAYSFTVLSYPIIISWNTATNPKPSVTKVWPLFLFLNSRCWSTMQTVHAELLAYPEIPIHCALAKTQHAKHLATIVSHCVKSYHEFGQKYHLPAL